MHIFRYITGCTDKKLRAKFLEQDDPNLPEFDRIVRAYERSHTTTRTPETRDAPQERVNQFKPRTDHKQNDKQEKKHAWAVAASGTTNAHAAPNTTQSAPTAQIRPHRVHMLLKEKRIIPNKKHGQTVIQQS